MSNEHELQWTNHKQVSAAELMLLTAGPHKRRPQDQSWMVIGTKPKTGDKRDWNSVALPVHNSNEYLPGIVESVLATVLDQDSYNSLQSFYRAASLGIDNPQFTHRKELADVIGPDGNKLRAAYRDSEGIARLNCCFVDIDYYNLGLTAGNVIGQIYDLQADGKIPSPSYLKDSGQGLWAVWLLGLEARHYQEHWQQWRAIQSKLHCMFANAGSDAQVQKDLARLTRIVGSKNTKSNRRANMVIFARDNEGQPIRYRLNDLADSLNCRIIKTKRVKTEPIAKLAKSAKAVKGQIARWEWDEKRFWTLFETIRKRVHEGLRHNAGFIIGAILRHRHNVPAILETEIQSAAARLYRRMERSKNKGDEHTLAMVENDIRDAATKRKRGVKISAQYIADGLQVTTYEAETLRDLHPTSGKGTWPPAQGQPEMKPTFDRAYRKSRIINWMVSNGYQVKPPLKELAAIIADTLGMKVSYRTLSDYRKELKPTPPPPEYTQAKLDMPPD
jgi:hypothetical protein